MTPGVSIRVTGRAGRITLDRPESLNALSYPMVCAIDAALRDWTGDDAVALVVIDAAGDKAFCAGGDVADLYATGSAGDFAYGRRFWQDEYRLNARLAGFPKPVVTLMQGFTMGGGVGIGCHASHRVVGYSSRIAMPEVGIGMLPDVGGSLLLAHAPGRLGEYLALTAYRMGPGDAIHAGFADCYVGEAAWPDLIADLVRNGEADAVAEAAHESPGSVLTEHRKEIDRLLAGHMLNDIVRAMRYDGKDFARGTLAAMDRHSPLAMACAVEAIHRMRTGEKTIRDALSMEYRYAFRAMEHGDFLEGVRALIIDKDRAPRWRHKGLDAVPSSDMVAMLAPLGLDALRLDADKENAP